MDVGEMTRLGKSVCARAGLVVALACIASAATPAIASAAFIPGRFVVAGRTLAAGAGKGISVYTAPQAVALDDCLTRKARVRPAGRGVSLTATVRCERRTVRLTARIGGSVMRGEARRGKLVRRFIARRARPVGVRLRGKRSAIGAVADVDRVQRQGSDFVSKVEGTRVARRELVVRLDRSAKVGQVNGLLRAFGAGIAGSLAGSPALIVAVPDPGSSRALQLLARRMGRRPGVRSVALSAMAQEQQLPPGIASPPSSAQRQALGHLLASGLAAAWNARSAIRPAEQPTVIIADSFGDGPLSRHIDAAYDRKLITKPRKVNGVLERGIDHGYQVASIIFGDFANDGSPAGLLTGAYPARGKLVPIDKIDLSLPATGLKIIETLEKTPGHVVVNTSQGVNGGQVDKEMFPQAADWIRNVRQRRLEERVVHVTSAGNDALSATGNGLWAASALRSDIFDYETGGVVGPLTNTLAVENVVEGEDEASLGCLFPTSNVDGTVAAPGDKVYSLGRDGKVVKDANSSGTSFATPIVTGLATYLWSIAPDLTPQQLKAAIVENPQPVQESERSCVSAPRIDAYKAVLSLDQEGPPSAAGYPVRLAILDVNGDGKFTDADVAILASRTDVGRNPTARDWSRFDLNGDGFTGGPHTAEFDLDRTGSERAGSTLLGSATARIENEDVTFDERAASDADVLCYYANSALYSGSDSARRSGCRLVVIEPREVTLAPGATQQFTATVLNSPNTAVTWSATDGSITQNGLYTAPLTPGMYTVTARSKQDPARSATASVTVSEGSITLTESFVNFQVAATAKAAPTITGLNQGCLAEEAEEIEDIKEEEQSSTSFSGSFDSVAAASGVCKGENANSSAEAHGTTTQEVSAQEGGLEMTLEESGTMSAQRTMPPPASALEAAGGDGSVQAVLSVGFDVTGSVSLSCSLQGTESPNGLTDSLYYVKLGSSFILSQPGGSTTFGIGPGPHALTLGMLHSATTSSAEATVSSSLSGTVSAQCHRVS